MNRRKFLKTTALVAGSLAVAPQFLFGSNDESIEPQGDRIICMFYIDCTGYPEQNEINWFLMEQARWYFKKAEILRIHSEYMFMNDYPDMWRCGGTLKVWGFTERGRRELGERFLKMKEKGQ